MNQKSDEIDISEKIVGFKLYCKKNMLNNDWGYV